MDTTSIAISSAALAVANQAKQRAHAAECRVIMREPDLSTVAARQTYASCVQFAEPVNSPPVPQAVKFGVLGILLVCLVGGVVFAKRERTDGFVEWILYTFIGMFFTGCGLAGVASVGWVIAWALGFVP